MGLCVSAEQKARMADRATKMVEISNIVKETQQTAFASFSPKLVKFTMPVDKLDPLPQEKFDECVKIITDSLNAYLKCLQNIKRINTLFDEIETIRPYKRNEKLLVQCTIGLAQDISRLMSPGKPFIENNIAEINKAARMADKQIHLDDLTIPYIRYAHLL